MYAICLLQHGSHVVHAEGRGAGDMASWQQAGIVLVALVSALLPKEFPGTLDDEADDQLLGEFCISTLTKNSISCPFTACCVLRVIPGRSDLCNNAKHLVAGELAAEPEVAKRLDSGTLPGDGFMAVARMAWGLLLAQHGPATARGDLKEDVAFLLCYQSCRCLCWCYYRKWCCGVYLT